MFYSSDHAILDYGGNDNDTVVLQDVDNKEWLALSRESDNLVVKLSDDNDHSRRVILRDHFKKGGDYVIENIEAAGFRLSGQQVIELMSSMEPSASAGAVTLTHSHLQNYWTPIIANAAG